MSAHSDLQPAGEEWTEVERELAQLAIARRELGSRRRIEGGEEA